MSIKSRIRTHLANDAQLATLLGPGPIRIRPLQAESDDPYPYCVYAVLEDQFLTGSNSGNGKLRSADVEFAVVAEDTETDIVTIANRIEDILPALEGVIGSGVRVDAVNVRGRSDDVEERDDADDRQLFIQRIAAQIIYMSWSAAGEYDPLEAPAPDHEAEPEPA